MEDKIKVLLEQIFKETGARVKKIDVTWTGFIYGANDEDYNPEVVAIDLEIAKEYKR